MNLTRIKEAINVAGSVASLTGISLLWLKSIAPQTKLAFAVPVYLIISMLSIGLMASAWLLFKFFYAVFFSGGTVFDSEASLAGQIAYTGLAGGILLILLGIALATLFGLGSVAMEGITQMTH
jgi:hypothetical protein